MRILCALLFLVGIFAQDTFGRRSETVRVGPWGGSDMGMRVEPDSAQIEFNCAHGSINQSIPLDRQGRFDVPGIYVQDHGGPGQQNEPPDSHPARYFGRVQGKTMSVTVELTDTMETIGYFTLTYGESPYVFKCL